MFSLESRRRSVARGILPVGLVRDPAKFRAAGCGVVCEASVIRLTARKGARRRADSLVSFSGDHAVSRAEASIDRSAWDRTVSLERRRRGSLSLSFWKFSSDKDECIDGYATILTEDGARARQR